MKYQIGDIVKIYIISESERERIGIIIKSRMWNEEVDYKMIICGKPNEDIWVLERLIIGKIDEI
jgi:hypothetical protein